MDVSKLADQQELIFLSSLQTECSLEDLWEQWMTRTDQCIYIYIYMCANFVEYNRQLCLNIFLLNEPFQ